MHRRTLLTGLTSLSVLSLTQTTRADSVPGPREPGLEVRAESTTWVGTPSELRLEVHNPTANALRIQPLRLLVRDGGLRLALHVTAVEVNGRPSAPSETLAPRATAHLRVSFDQLPQTALRRRSLSFIVRIGYESEYVFTLNRARG